MARTGCELTFRGRPSLPPDVDVGRMEVTRGADRTVLQGPLPTAVALETLLARLRGAGLELLHVRLTLYPDDASEAEGR